ncbi:MAG: bifunctional pyr operon transcriptional regulator/uracil phosphoribosyltransferase PyrR [Verrucomicrobia bacterium]|nr:bifunctional pyr operon transcriptional regulator/uracil phosphoribosyltransferase PyrR [Verrucomicrobiota bacterium]
MPDSPAAPVVADVQPLLNGEAIARTVHRLAEEIAASVDARHGGAGFSRLVLVGIYSRGVEIARRLAATLAELKRSAQPVVGALDVSMHRDDLWHRPRLESMQTTELPLDLDDRDIVLVDDVFFTGRTIRAALDALRDFGRPRRVQLAVLVERAGHRELPIRPDFAGASVVTAFEDRVRVRLRPNDEEGDGVWLRPVVAPPSHAPQTP